MDLTPAYETICDIIVDNENIITVEDLRNHLGTTDLVYTEDDMLLAYNWSGQAVKRIMKNKVNILL